MSHIELSDEEAEVVSQILRSSLATLELEIGHTDHLEFKMLLKRRREILRGLLSRLPQASPAGA